MYKPYSIVLILLSSVISSFCIKNSFANRNKILSAFIEMTEYIKNQIAFFNLPLKEIISNFSNETLEKNGILSAMDLTKSDCGFSEISALGVIDENAEKELCFFFTSLGKSSREEQIRLCEYTEEFLKENRTKILLNEGQKIKTYSCLCIVCGMLFVILII